MPLNKHDCNEELNTIKETANQNDCKPKDLQKIINKPNIKKIDNTIKNATKNQTTYAYRESEMH